MVAMPVKLPYPVYSLEARYRKAVLFDFGHSVAVPRNFFGWSGFFYALFCRLRAHFGSRIPLVKSNCISYMQLSYFLPVESITTPRFYGLVLPCTEEMFFPRTKK
jgi:hypothetical protein